MWDIIEECGNAQIASEDMVTLNLKSKDDNLKKKLDSTEHILSAKKDCWSTTKLDELNDLKEYIEKKLDLTQLLLKETKEQEIRFGRMAKRKKEYLIHSNRLKRRRISSDGRPAMLDSEDEKFICKAIEEKATYHGRRKEQTMFTNRRVKIRDLKNIANYSLKQRDKKTIKYCTTVLNRSKPKNKRSTQSMRHIRQGLFCTRQPPKTEKNCNENTHKKNIMHTFYAKLSYNRKYCYACSIDGKLIPVPVPVSVLKVQEIKES